MTPGEHPSSSEVQRAAEEEIVAAFARTQAVALHRDPHTTRIDVGAGAWVQVDAASDDHGTIVEA